MNLRSSSLENPLAFFDYLYIGYGIEAIKKEFIPKDLGEEGFDPYVTYDSQTEIKEDGYFDNEKGEDVIVRIKFQDFLYT